MQETWAESSLFPPQREREAAERKNEQEGVLTFAPLFH